ncbi:MAG: hypothetical protein DRP00_01980 [Candidatus Aenigmatarchaeota archaeon]|nr:MAG: hypothetical protein DRP00_01980 [Candidatus Aenigmarchaeota archaeon]
MGCKYEIRNGLCSLMPYRGQIKADFPHLLESSGRTNFLKDMERVFGGEYANEEREYFPCAKENCPWGFYNSDSKNKK